MKLIATKKFVAIRLFSWMCKNGFDFLEFEEERENMIKMERYKMKQLLVIGSIKLVGT